jgi:hypothetical protein
MNQRIRSSVASIHPGPVDALQGHQLRFASQGSDRLHRGAAQVAVVVGGLAPDRRVDPQLDLAGADGVLNVGSSISLCLVAVVSSGPGYGLAARPGWSAINLRKM